jgi:transcriptional regulator with XRE-family HTH domain
MISPAVAKASESRETVGERLKRLRQEQGLSQRALASPGVSYAYISRIEAGTRQPSMKALRKLAAKLAVSPDYLETGNELVEGERRELRLADAELTLRLGDSASAETELRSLAAEAEAAGDLTTASRAQLDLALAADDRGEHAAAIASFEAAFAFERPSPLVRLDVYATLGRAYGALGENAKEIGLYERCLDELEDLPDGKTAQTRYRILLSYALSDAGDLEEAERVLHMALKEAVRDDDPYMRIRVFWSLARLAEMEGRSAAALRYARRAIALLEATEDHLHRARAHLLAAWIMNSTGNSDATEQLDLAEVLFGEVASSDDLARVKVERSRCAAVAGNGTDAVRFAQEAIDLLHGEHAPILGTALAALGEGRALEGDVDAASDAFRRGVDLLEETHRWREALLACRTWGQLLRNSDRQHEALDVLDRASQLALHTNPSLLRRAERAKPQRTRTS